MKLKIDDFPDWNKKFVIDDLELRILMDHLEFSSTMKILEVGCNDTELSNVLHDKGCEIWGVDILPCPQAKFKFVQGNFQDVYIPTNYFDIVIDVSAIHHFGLGNYGDRIDIDADITSSKKIHNSLKQNGLFYISMDRIYKKFDPNINNYTRIYNIEEFVERIARPPDFKIIDLKFYIISKYPLIETEYFYHFSRYDNKGNDPKIQLYSLLQKI